MKTKKRILFVDDEENVLKNLNAMLRSIRKDWSISLAQSGEEALDIMEREEPFDMVVSDMQMPMLHGIDFLREVKARYPSTIRFGLSGMTDHSTMLKGAVVAHQYLGRPCEPQQLHDRMARSLVLHDQFRSERLKKVLVDVGSLPALPAVCQKVIDEINGPDPSAARMGEIIQTDPGVSIKTLQLVNSAYLGLKHHVTDLRHAVALLGLRVVHDIVLMVGVFSVGDQKSMPRGFVLDTLWEHSLKVGEFAKRIVELESEDVSVAQDAFAAGILHEVGQLILAMKLPDEFHRALELAEEELIPLLRAEQGIFGVTHAEIGGFLLDLWGLPDTVVEAVTYHAHPSARPEELYPTALSESLPESVLSGFSPLVAVHIANYFCEDDENVSEERQTAMDAEFLNELGLTERISTYWDVCYLTDNPV